MKSEKPKIPIRGSRSPEEAFFTHLKNNTTHPTFCTPKLSPKKNKKESEVDQNLTEGKVTFTSRPTIKLSKAAQERHDIENEQTKILIEKVKN
jgi:hypothetical protein